MPKPTRPLDIYVRVSRVGGRENLISPDEQERRARELAKERGLRVHPEILTDLDESGGKWERPGLQAALERVRTGKSGGIIVAWLDRLSRDSEHAHRLVRELNESGGVILAPDAPADWQSPEGELQASIFFGFAQYQRSRARAGFERAKARAIENGIPVKTRPPVGYRRRNDRHLEPDPTTAPVVRELFERRAAGEGPSALGAFLTASGVKTSQGSRTWSKQAVYNVLRNRVYLGELSYGLDRRFVNADAFEPIVDLALWTAAQQSSGVLRLAPARSAGSQFLLTGIARCSSCRYCLQGTTSSRGKRLYRCTRTHAGGICPAPVRVDAATVEAVAVAAFWTLTGELEAAGRQDDSGEAPRLAYELERAEKALAGWTSTDVQEAIGDDVLYAQGLRERRTARDQAAGKLGEAQAKSRGGRDLPDLETLRAAWGRMTAQERRHLLALRFDCLALHRDGSIVAYPAGSGPDDLPRRGFKTAPVLEPFPDPPDGARTLSLEEALEEAAHGRVRLDAD
jgi:site-specific DNA recombinase